MLSGTQAVLQQKHDAGTCERQKRAASSLNRIQIDMKHSSYATANDEFSAEAIRATPSARAARTQKTQARKLLSYLATDRLRTSLADEHTWNWAHPDDT